MLSGHLRGPGQMLAVQTYQGHTSIHDDATAQQLGFKAGTIEGPTHFSQFAPLCYAVWGESWFAQGCLSVLYRAPAFEGDELRAYLRRPLNLRSAADIWLLRNDGTEILRGSASVGAPAGSSAVQRRLSVLKPLSDPVILADVRLGALAEREPAQMNSDQYMGALYPFSLRQKLEKITEPSPWYATSDNPWSRPIVPFEMISVLMQHGIRENQFSVRGPAVGLFADQEIRLLQGPVFVGEPYEIGREVLFLTGTRRTESMWVRSTLYYPGSDIALVEMTLNMATMKLSYERYEEERRALYGELRP